MFSCFHFFVLSGGLGLQTISIDISLKQLINIASAPKPTVRQDVATDEWAGPGKSSIEEFVQHTKCNKYYPASAPRRALLYTTNLQAYYQPRNHGH